MEELSAARYRSRRGGFEGVANRSRRLIVILDAGVVLVEIAADLDSDRLELDLAEVARTSDVDHSVHAPQRSNH
jgi:hypothetical protein